MAIAPDSLEEILSCQVCFEEFEEDGDHVPRILPCSHTLCHTCVERLIHENKIECPECHEKHETKKEGKTFPQNKYILVNIKRRPTLKEENLVSPQLPEVDVCEKHNRPRSLFCIKADCQKLVCPLCLKDEHRNHDFEDAKQILKEKRNVLVDNMKLLRDNLLANREKLLMEKEDATKNRTECIEKITKAKDEQIRTVVRMMTQLYDQMIAEVDDNFADVSSSIDKKTGEWTTTYSF